MDNSEVMKSLSDMNDEGEDGEANTELEARLYAEIYYSNEINDKMSPPQEQCATNTIIDVKNRRKNIADTCQRIEASNPTNSQLYQESVNEPQPVLGESSDNSHNLEGLEVDESNGNSKRIVSAKINKKVNSKKGQTPKKKKSQNVESVTNRSGEEIDVTSLGKPSKGKKKQAHETQSEYEFVNINNDNAGTELNKANKTSRNRKSKVCHNDSVSPSNQESHNIMEQFVAEDSVSSKIIENERIISENPVTSNPSGSLNPLEEATDDTSSSKKRRASKSKKKNSKNANVETSPSRNRTERQRLSKSKKLKKQGKQSKRKNDNTVPLIILTSSESSDTTSESYSKYTVSSKKTKIKEKERSQNHMTSDSDDSILEVPVPPKPKPQIINLNDSDEENGDIENIPNSPTNSFSSDDQLITQNAIETADSESLSIPDLSINQTVAPTGANDIPVSTFETTSSESSNDSQPVEQVLLDDALSQTNSIARPASNAHSAPENQPLIDSEEEDNIILNCTEIQKGASSLEEIRQMSGTAASKQVNSDDSMTESEANNWDELAASRVSLNDSETASLSSMDRVSISEKEVSTDSQRNAKPRKSKSRKCSDNPTKESHDANKENSISELSGNITFNFQADSDDQETNSTDIAQTLTADTEVHLELTQEAYAEKNDPVIIPSQSSNKSPKEKSPNKRKRLSDTAIGPSTSSKQGRYSDAEAGPSGAGPGTPKKKNVEKSSRRNCAADYFFLPMSDELKTFYNESWGGEHFDMHQFQNEMPRDPRQWAILDADICNPARRQRYWSSLKCKQCNSDGHNKATCPFPKKVPNCHMCGKQGHTEPRCPEKRCLTCGRATSSYIKTCEYCRKLKCATCGSKGHEKSMCPDLWRRFHRTTNKLTVTHREEINMIMKPANQLHCCNCARRGHDYKDCAKYRWSQHFPTPSYVTSYTDGPHYINNTDNEVIEILDESFVNDNNDERADVHVIGEKESQPVEVPTDVEMAQEKIIYSHASLHPIKKPQLWQRHWIGEDTQIECVINGDIMPLFIEDLAKRIPLEFTITAGEKFYLQFILKCETTHLKYCRAMINSWVDRDEVDKNHIIVKELPLQRSEMIHLLSNKLNEIKTNFGNPVDLLNEIRCLKRQVKEFQRNKTSNTLSKIARTRLKKLEYKLVLSLKCQNRKGKRITPNLSNITQILDNLRNMTCYNLPPESLLNIMLLVNQYFGHYVPRRAENLVNNQQRQHKKSKKTDGSRKNPPRAARNDLIASNVHDSNSASISNVVTNPTNIETECSGNTENLSHTITSETLVEPPTTLTTTALPNPAIFDIHVTPQLLLPLPPLLKNPYNVNFMNNKIFLRPDNVGQENFLPLETPRISHNDTPYAVPPQNLYQDGPWREIGPCSGVQYQSFGTLGLPYESHLNNIHGAPYQFCYYNAPQNVMQTNQCPTSSHSHDIVTDDIVCLDENQVKGNDQSTQMQHQNPPANTSKPISNAKANRQKILKARRAKRKERLERNRREKQNERNRNRNKNLSYEKMKEAARVAVLSAQKRKVYTLN